MLVEPQDQFNHSASAEVLDLVPEFDFDSAHFDMFAKKKSTKVIVDEIVFIHKESGDQYSVTLDEISAAFGQSVRTTFQRIFGDDGNRLPTPEYLKTPERGQETLERIHQMVYRPKDGSVSKTVGKQEIIDRIIQYRAEEQLKLYDALEDVLLAGIDAQEDEIAFSEDDIILSTGETFADFSARVGNDVRIEIVEEASDENIRDGLVQAERNRLEIEVRAKQHPQDSRGLQGLLKDTFPKVEKPDGKNLFNRLLQAKANTTQNILELARGLSPKQARFAEATALTLSILTTQFSQTAMEIAPDAVTVTSLADVNAQAEQQAEREAQAEQQRCMQSITPEQMIDIRVNLFKQSQFYKDNVNSKDPKKRAQAIWVEIVADAVKEVWAKDGDSFKATGYQAFSSVDELFRMEIFKAYAESHGNKFKYNAGNPLVAGLYHDSIITARSIMKMRDLDEMYPDAFRSAHLDKSDLTKARKATILDLYISLEDHKYSSNRADGKVHEVFPRYHWYNLHVNGGPKGYPLLEAAYERPTKTDRNGQKVLKTAVDIVGRGVANDNPSLYYRTVKIYNGQEVTTAYIATLPKAAVKKVRDKRIAHSVDEALNIVTARAQNQAGIESLGHASPEVVRSAALATCGAQAPKIAA